MPTVKSSYLPYECVIAAQLPRHRRLGQVQHVILTVKSGRRLVKERTQAVCSGCTPMTVHNQ
jgi:hypothetical protein